MTIYRLKSHEKKKRNRVAGGLPRLVSQLRSGSVDCNAKPGPELILKAGVDVERGTLDVVDSQVVRVLFRKGDTELHARPGRPVRLAHVPAQRVMRVFRPADDARQLERRPFGRQPEAADQGHERRWQRPVRIVRGEHGDKRDRLGRYRSAFRPCRQADGVLGRLPQLHGRFLQVASDGLVV